MADIADEAQELQEKEIQFAMAARTRHVLSPKGECYYCETAVGPAQLFCDHECADGYELLEQANARRGLRPAHGSARRY